MVPYGQSSNKKRIHPTFSAVNIFNLAHRNIASVLMTADIKMPVDNFSDDFGVDFSKPKVHDRYTSVSTHHLSLGF